MSPALVWDEWVRDTRLPGRWAQRLDTPAGRVVRRWASPLQPLVWLATGTPPSRIGYAPGPLLRARRRRHARLDRPVRLCLLEGPEPGQRFSPVTAYWVNERSRVVQAVVDEPAGADVLWVHAQDPLSPAARAYLDGVLRGATVPVLNPPDRYDAYHHEETFRVLRDAGVRVPDPDPAPGALVVLKGPGQASRKQLTRLGEVPPGHRAFAYVDARGPDGLHRRYRVFCLLGTVHAGDVVASSAWEVGLRTLEQHAPTFTLTADERVQVRRVGEVLDLDWYCVDLVRRAGDGLAFVTDVNVYPTPVVAEQVDAALGARGRWHFLDTATRMGVPEPDGVFWPRFDDAVLRLVEGRLSPAAAAAPAPASRAAPSAGR